MSDYCNTIQLDEIQQNVFAEFDHVPSHMSELNNCKKIYIPKMHIPLSKEKKIRIRNEIPIPTNSVNLLHNLMNEGDLIENLTSRIIENITKNDDEIALKNIDELYLVFSLAKKIHEPHTLNYKIFDEINDIILELRESVKQKKSDLNTLMVR